MKRLLCLCGVIAVCLSLYATSAGAQILYSGGEDIDFQCAGSGACVVIPSAAYRAGWARSAYGVAGTVNDPPINRFSTSTFTASSTIWIHGQFCEVYDSFTGWDACGQNITGVPTTANAQMIRVFDSAGNPSIVVSGTGSGGQLVVASRSSSGVFTTLTTCSSAITSALSQVDLAINYGASGSVTLYNNGAQVCSYSGNVTNGDGATTLDRVGFASPTTAAQVSSAWSEIIVAGSDTRAMARFTANTLGNGTTTGFTGTNICSSIWNASSYNDANFGYTSANDTIQECTINSTLPAGSYSVLGVVMSARALVGSTGPQHFDFVTQIGGTEYTSPDMAPLNAFSNLTNYIQAVNPATSNPWSISDIQATGFNLGEESKP